MFTAKDLDFGKLGKLLFFLGYLTALQELFLMGAEEIGSTI